MSPILGIWASQNYPRVTNSYESISTVTVGSGGSSSIDFTSIPQTYKHLQIRLFGRDNTSNTSAAGFIKFNSDNGSNYAGHQLYGDGASAAASSSTATTPLNTVPTFTMAGGNASASIFGMTIIDVLDYTNTNKYKVTRALNGLDVNGNGGYVLLRSNLWLSTAAITSISLLPNGTTIQQYSSFALYGIKG